MLDNLTGWHVLVILGVLATMALVVVAIIVVVIRLVRKNVRHPVTSSPDPVEEIRRLAQLRDEGLLSDTEYEAKRAERMGRI